MCDSDLVWLQISIGVKDDNIYKTFHEGWWITVRDQGMRKTYMAWHGPFGTSELK